MIKAVFFDAFGTLFQVEKGASARTVMAHLAKHGVQVDAPSFHAQWKAFYSQHTAPSHPFLTERQIFTHRIDSIYRQYQVPGNAKLDAAMMLEAAASRPAYPDVKPALEALKSRYSLYIASNTDNATLLCCMERNGIHVDGTFTSEDFRCYKPAPAFYRHLLSKTGFLPQETLFIGDSFAEDVEGPIRAGMHSLMLIRDRGAKNIKTASIHSLDEFPAYIQSLK